MTDGPTLVLSALPEELAALERRLEDVRRTHTGRVPVTLGSLAGRPLALVVAGEGAVSVAAGSEALARIEPELVVIAGAAGALTADLRPGSLLVARAVLGPDRRRLVAPPALIARACAFGAVPGLVVTAPALVATPVAKRALYASVGGAGCAVVDLESAGLAAAAEASRRPWVVLRAVSDTVDEALPSFLVRCQRDGATSRARVVGHALIRPAAIGDLLRLAFRIRACSAALAAAVESLVLSIGTAPHVASAR